MTKFAAHLINPFHPSDVSVAECETNGSPTESSLRKLTEFTSDVITHDSNSLINSFIISQNSPPPKMLDIGILLRMIAGVSKDEGGERKWSYLKALKRVSGDHESINLLSGLSNGSLPSPDQKNLEELVGLSADGIRNLWIHITNDERNKIEVERFLKIEAPIQRIFNHRQFLGIKTDSNIVQSLIDEVKDEKYKAYVEVAKILNISPSGLNFRNVGKLLNRTDLAHLHDVANSPSLEEYFKIASHASPFARAFLDYVRADRNLLILNRIAVRKGRLHPRFLTFGTVTGRILVEDPYLQNLQKKYRKVILADEGKSLLYLDYGQFEPGILAWLSRDKNLTSDYNSSDLYEALSKNLFGDAAQRKICKRIFLAYCYGMTPDRISFLLAGGDKAKVPYFSDKTAAFFAKFDTLQKFKSKLEQDLERNGYIESIFGNRRYRLKNGLLDNKEKRWAISQAVQGTASLIFKDAVIKLAENFGDDAVLLPMHDAILLQFDSKDLDKFSNVAKEIMIKCFSTHCEGITPKVELNPFC